MTTRDDIRRMISETVARDPAVTHVLIMVDWFDYTDYPVGVHSGEKARKMVHDSRTLDAKDRVMEVYSLTGVHDIEAQLAEDRAFHYD